MNIYTRKIGMDNKRIILAAQMVSLVFTPFYLPLVGLLLLFLFSGLSYLTWSYKFSVLLVVYVFTILLPTTLIHLYRRYQGWNLIELGRKERRMVPYVISILCYFACYYVMAHYRMPHIMGNILMTALVIQVTCAVINIWWKISTHSAAIGGVTGAVIGFSLLFFFNPIWWFCWLTLLSGIVGSARMVLRQHSLSQVVTGFLLGFLIALHIVLFT